MLGPDIVHFHDPYFLPFALRLKNKGYKVIYDIHESYPEVFYYKRWIPKIFRGPISYFYSWYEFYVSCRIDAVVSTTEHIEDRFKLRGIKSLVVRNFPKIIDFEDISMLNSSKVTRLCYAGTISKGTCIKEIVDSLADIQKCRTSFDRLGSWATVF